MNAPRTFKVGDTLWAMPRWHNHRPGRDVTITKVGRLFIHCSNGAKLSIGTMLAEGQVHGDNEVYYASKTQYETTRRTTQEKANLVDDLRRGYFDLQQITAARQALGLPPIQPQGKT